MGSRIFLGASALMWLPYGLLCLVDPASLEGTAGIAASTATGTVELRAMYGGLQAAIGALCVLGCLSSSWRRHALITVGALTAGLFLGRLVGVVAGGGVSSYTAAALAIEITSAVVGLGLARKSAWA